MICSCLSSQSNLVSFYNMVSRIIQFLKYSKLHFLAGHFHMSLHLHGVPFASLFQNIPPPSPHIDMSFSAFSFYDKPSSKIPLGLSAYTLNELNSFQQLVNGAFNCLCVSLFQIVKPTHP